MMCDLAGDDDVATGFAVHRDGNQIVDGAGRQKYGRFLALQCGAHVTQTIDAWVLAALFVANLRRGHGSAHTIVGAGRVEVSLIRSVWDGYSCG